MDATKYDKQDQQGKAAFKKRNPHMTQQQEPEARSPGGPQTKTGQGTIMYIILLTLYIGIYHPFLNCLFII
jgi:hypothetical protein